LKTRQHALIFPLV